MWNRIVKLSFVAAACFSGLACKDNNSSKSAAADNTAKNKRDRDPAAKTSFDQSESSPDIRITAEIRREIMKGENLSTDAQNCKIITEQGAVTLRGPVKNESEKEKIGTWAANVAGVIRVDNQLEIKTP